MGLFDKFKIGLGKSSDGLTTGFKNIFSKKKIDENVLTEFEELIITSDAGVEVAKELAFVLSGGDTTVEKTLTEDDLFKLELDAFMRLIETKKTQERIKHTLATGKPLVN